MSGTQEVFVILGVALIAGVVLRGISDDWADAYRTKWEALKVKYEFEQPEEESEGNVRKIK